MSCRSRSKLWSPAFHVVMIHVLAWIIVALSLAPTAFAASARPPDSDLESYTVQVLSTTNLAAIEALAAEMQQVGLRPEIMIGDGAVIRLRVGRFSSAGDAQRQAERWKRQGLIRDYVIAAESGDSASGMRREPAGAVARAADSPGTRRSDDSGSPAIALGQLLTAIEGRWAINIPPSILGVPAGIVLPHASIVRTAVSLRDAWNQSSRIPPPVPDWLVGGSARLQLEAGIRLSHDGGVLTEGEILVLAAQLRRISGYQDLHFDKDHFLVLGNAVRGGSPLARDLLKAAVSSPDVFQIESYDGDKGILFGAVISSEYGYGESRAVVNRIQLDFEDFGYLQGDPRVVGSFGPGFIFLHELAHVVWKLTDDDKYAGLGECEAYINQIRRELNLPERIRYEFRVRRGPAGRELGELWFIRQPMQKNERRTYEKLYWDSSEVGTGVPLKVK